MIYDCKFEKKNVIRGWFRIPATYKMLFFVTGISGIHPIPQKSSTLDVSGAYISLWSIKSFPVIQFIKENIFMEPVIYFTCHFLHKHAILKYLEYRLESVTIWRLYDRSNACECMLTLFFTFMSFRSVSIS